MGGWVRSIIIAGEYSIDDYRNISMGRAPEWIWSIFCEFRKSRAVFAAISARRRFRRHEVAVLKGRRP